MFDVIIIGGSYAGMSAGLQLARARRKILVLDGGSRRNRFADSSHGFLTQDGRAPGAIASDARAQLVAYPTVKWTEVEAAAARKTDTGFSVMTVDGDLHQARRLLLSYGVTDQLPDIPGLAERWGKSVFHCPYCHGYELDQGLIGVLGVSPLSIHHALMLPDWGPTTFLLNDAFVPDDGQMAQLQKRGATVEKTPVARIAGDRADVELADGRVVRLDGLFTQTRTTPSSTIAEALGCIIEESPTGTFIQTNAVKETSVPGVFACGDAARAFGSVTLAVGDGAMAGAGVHQSLIFREN